MYVASVGSAAAKAAFAAGDYQLAASLFTTLIDDGAADDHHLQLCNRSAALLKLGLQREAADDARLAVALSPPNFVKGHYRLASALHAANELEETLQTCRAALRITPDHPQLVELAERCAAALSSPRLAGSRVQITSRRPEPPPGAPLPAPRPLAQAPAPAWPLLRRFRCQLFLGARWLCRAVLPIGLARRWLAALPLPRGWLQGTEPGTAVAPAAATVVPPAAATPEPAAAPPCCTSPLSTLDADAFDACLQQLGLCDLLHARCVSHAWAAAARRELGGERWGGFGRVSQLPRGTFVLSSELLRLVRGCREGGLAWRQQTTGERPGERPDHTDLLEGDGGGGAAAEEEGAMAEDARAQATWVVIERASGTLTLRPFEPDPAPGSIDFWAHGRAETEPLTLIPDPNWVNTVSLRLGLTHNDTPTPTPSTTSTTSTAATAAAATPRRRPTMPPACGVALLWKRMGCPEQRFHPLRVVRAEVSAEVQRFVLSADRSADDFPNSVEGRRAERDRIELECTLLYES